MKTNVSIEIKGTVAGTIWWPQVTAWKDFTYRVKDDDTLRDAVLHITNDGDFQNCSIFDATVIATLYKQNKKIVRYFDIRSPLFPSIADCLLDENGKEYDSVICAMSDMEQE